MTVFLGKLRQKCEKKNPTIPTCTPYFLSACYANIIIFPNYDNISVSYRWHQLGVRYLEQYLWFSINTLTALMLQHFCLVRYQFLVQYDMVVMPLVADKIIAWDLSLQWGSIPGVVYISKHIAVSACIEIWTHFFFSKFFLIG